MTTLPFIIGCALSGFVGLVVGMFAAFYYEKDTLRQTVVRVTCRTISRMQEAMRSLGYNQDDIEAVVRRMGEKFMPPYIPAPKPQENKASADQSEEEHKEEA